MSVKRRKPLGPRLPAVKEVAAPNDELLDRVSTTFDSIMPDEWRGALEPKTPGTPDARFYRDELTGVVTRARDGLVMTAKVKRFVMNLYTEKRRGAK